MAIGQDVALSSRSSATSHAKIRLQDATRRALLVHARDCYHALSRTLAGMALHVPLTCDPATLHLPGPMDRSNDSHAEPAVGVFG
jgi:hypothetical protein